MVIKQVTAFQFLKNLWSRQKSSYDQNKNLLPLFDPLWIFKVTYLRGLTAARLPEYRGSNPLSLGSILLLLWPGIIVTFNSWFTASSSWGLYFSLGSLELWEFNWRSDSILELHDDRSLFNSSLFFLFWMMVGVWAPERQHVLLWKWMWTSDIIFPIIRWFSVWTDSVLYRLTKSGNCRLPWQEGGPQPSPPKGNRNTDRSAAVWRSQGEHTWPNSSSTNTTEPLEGHRARAGPANTNTCVSPEVHGQSNYQAFPCEPLHDIKGRTSDVITELPHHCPQEIAKNIRSDTESTVDPNHSRGCERRKALMILAKELQDEKLCHPSDIKRMFELLADVTGILHAHAAHRTPRTVLHLSVALWRHFSLNTTIWQYIDTVVEKPWHDCTAWATVYHEMRGIAPSFNAVLTQTSISR